MALAELLQAMEAEAAAEEARLMESARGEADTLLAAAHNEVAATRQRHLAEAEATVRATRARLQAEARLRIRSLRAGVQEAMVSQAFAQALEALAEVRESPDYHPALGALLIEALGQFPPEESLHVHCDARDLPLLAELAREASYNITIEPSLQCSGGVIVRASTGRIEADNTIEGRLEQARRTIWPRVAALALGSPGPDLIPGYKVQGTGEPTPDRPSPGPADLPSTARIGRR